MRKIAAVLALLVSCARAQEAVRFSDSRKMTPEEFHKIPDDPYSDPVDDIPKVNGHFQLPPPPATPKPSYFAPRDQYLAEAKKTGKMLPEAASDKRAHLWIDFVNLHDYLIQEQAKPGFKSPKSSLRGQGRISSPEPRNKSNHQLKEPQFEPGTFVLKSADHFGASSARRPIVWTTCDEFKSRNYNPLDIVNFVWIPFYSWSRVPHTDAYLHTFKIPTNQQLYYFHTKFSPYLNDSVDWNQPKLYLDVDFGFIKVMLISADRAGLYYYITDSEISEFVQRNKIFLTLITVRLKIVGEYLALMFCEDNSAKIMTRKAHMPLTNKDKREAAKILKFKGKGRPLTRDPLYIQTQKKAHADWEKELEDMKRPINMGETPIGRRRNKEKSNNRIG